MLGRANLHWIFSSTPKDGSDIDRFSKEVGHDHMLHWKSEKIRGIPK